MTTTNDPENYPRRVRAGEIIGHTTPDTTPSPGAHPRPAWQREVLSQRATVDLEQADKAHKAARTWSLTGMLACLAIGVLGFMGALLAPGEISPERWALMALTAFIAVLAAVDLVRTLRDPATRNPVDALRAAAEADCTAAGSAHRYVCETVGRLSDDEIDSWISRLTPHRDRLRKISDDADNPDRPGRTIAPSIRARLDSAATTHAQTLNLLRRELSDRARIDT